MFADELTISLAIVLSSFHHGETELGYDFGQAYSGFAEQIERPYVRFTKRVFCEFAFGYVSSGGPDCHFERRKSASLGRSLGPLIRVMRPTYQTTPPPNNNPTRAARLHLPRPSTARPTIDRPQIRHALAAKRSPLLISLRPRAHRRRNSISFTTRLSTAKKGSPTLKSPKPMCPTRTPYSE
jgi:hypothetical protein